MAPKPKNPNRSSRAPARHWLRLFLEALTGRQLILLTLFLLLLVAAVGLLGFRFQLTGSAPRGIYRFVDSELERGALVIVCPPPAVAVLGKHRGYLYPGPCDGEVAPILKTVAAVPGDRVRLERSGLWVNGVPVAGTEVLERDSAGRVLPHPAWGEYVVEEGTVWVVSTYTRRSFDSRYFGAVPSSRVLTVAEGVFTEADL